MGWCSARRRADSYCDVGRHEHNSAPAADKPSCQRRKTDLGEAENKGCDAQILLAVSRKQAKSWHEKWDDYRRHRYLY